jgi:hypothetical protein
MACGCKKNNKSGIEALSLIPGMEGSYSMVEEVFKNVPAGLKASAVPKTYYIRASDAAKYNNRNRHLKITSPNQAIPEPIRDWLVSDYRYKHDFAATAPVVAEVPVVETETVTLFPADDTQSEVVDVDLDNDTLYIQAYDAAMLYEHVDENDFPEMSLDELQSYVTHYSIDIGRATSETTIREKVTEWYLNANLG